MPWTRFRKKRDMPEGLWTKCPHCAKTHYTKDLEANHSVCDACGYHGPIPAAKRLELLLDPGSLRPMWEDLNTVDRLGFVDSLPYPKKLEKATKKSQRNEAALAGVGNIEGLPFAICVLDFSFMGGSMGTVVGERVTRTIEFATEQRLPAVVVSCSGGARMHEGVLSLMQLGKTSAALARHHDRGGLFISVLTHPTTGGVTASFAALGDVIVAEPKSLIGFAGPRVIQETLRTELPEGFQTAEFLLEKGFIDRIVARPELRAELGQLLAYLWRYDEATLARWKVEPPPQPEQDEPVEEAGAGDEAGEPEEDVSRD